MPTQKDLKRLVRRRMQKTGESYTAARAQLLRSRTAGEPPAPAPARSRFPDGPSPAEYPSIAGMSDAAVRAATGCDWKEWVHALDYAGAYEWPHAAIAKHLSEKFGVPGWWTQMVTVGYERIRGLRQVGQRRGGGFEANRSRTFAVPVAKLFAAFANARTRNRWLPGIKPVVRKATADRSVRMTWPDGTSVQVWFIAKGAAKSSAQVQHAKLADREAMERAKAFWGERLEGLEAVLAPRAARTKRTATRSAGRRA